MDNWPILTESEMKRGSAEGKVHWVLVLGDFGRSPRMQYHTLSLSKNAQSSVHVLAYGGSSPFKEILSAKNVKLHLLPSRVGPHLPRILGVLLRMMYQLVYLLYLVFFGLPRPDNILLQNPPAIPSMLVGWVAARWHRSRLVIDWHNFAYSIMAMKYKPWLVGLAKGHEIWMGKKCSHHLCVTVAMAEYMQEEWGIRATVLHDKPWPHFHPLTPMEKQMFLEKCEGVLLKEVLGAPLPGVSGTTKDASFLSVMGENGHAHARHRPAIVVSSTSWTPDEDFQLLLDAAACYDGVACCEGSRLPHLLVVVTGKGPDKEKYKEKMSKMKFGKVSFSTPWLEAEDYPRMLGTADLGVSLHMSSSGLDLPMKVVDMFGAGLPVCAVRYSCIEELVKPGVNGLLFDTSGDLAQQWQQLFRGFPDPEEGLLLQLAEGARTSGRVK